MKGREVNTIQGAYRSGSNYQTPRDILEGDNTLAQKTLGKAKVSLCLQEDQLLWGTYKQQNVGILQFLTTRSEPPGYKLCWLQTKVIFSEQDPSQILHSSANQMQLNERVWILRRPSPRLIKGGELIKSRQKDWKADPNVDSGAGPTVSLGHYGENSTWEDKRYWRYESNWEAVYQRNTIATWQWTANEFNRANEDLKDMYAGVVLGHAEQPFYVTCKIEGKLLSTAKQGWYKLSQSRAAETPLSFKVDPIAAQIDLDQSVDELEKKIEELTKRALATVFQ